MCALAGDAPRACLPDQHFQLGGVGFTDSLGDIEKKLGKPDSIGTYAGEDDGGPYTGKRLTFPTLEVLIDDLRGVERISTRSDKASLSLGVRVGMGIRVVANLLHVLPYLAQGSDSITMDACNENEAKTRLQLTFSSVSGQDPILVRIDIEQYGP